MRKSSNIAIFLALLLLLSPFAEAETIQVINYIPRLHSQKHQSSSHDHGQSLQKINLLLDNLKEEINQEFGSQSGDSHEESKKESESEATEKQSDSVERTGKKHSMKSQLRTESNLKAKESKKEDEDSSSSQDTKIVKEKLDHIINVMKSTVKTQTKEEEKPRPKSQVEHKQTETKVDSTQIQQKSGRKKEEKIEKQSINEQKVPIAHDKVEKKIGVEQPLVLQETKQDKKHEQIKIAKRQQIKHTQVHQEPLQAVKHVKAEETISTKTEQAEHLFLTVPSQMPKEPVVPPTKVELVQPPEAKNEDTKLVNVTPPTEHVQTLQKQVQVSANTSSSQKIETSKDQGSSSLDKQLKVIAVPQEIQAETAIPQKPKVETRLTQQNKEETKIIPEEEVGKRLESLEDANIPQLKQQETGHQQEKQVATIKQEHPSTHIVEVTPDHAIPLLPQAHHEPEAMVAAEHIETTDHQEQSTQTTEKKQESAQTNPVAVEESSPPHEIKTEIASTPIVSNQVSFHEKAKQQPTVSLAVEQHESSSSDHKSIQQKREIVPAQVQVETQKMVSKDEVKKDENQRASLVSESETHKTESETHKETTEIHNTQTQTQSKVNVAHVSLATQHENIEAEPTITSLSSEHATPLETTQAITSQDHVTIPVQEEKIVTETPPAQSHSSFMASICMPMCDYQSSTPVCEHQVCRACQADTECIEELSIFQAHPQDFTISCDIPTGKCLKKENDK